MVFKNSMFDKGELIGVDIGAYSVKAVRVHNTSRGPILLSAGYRELPSVNDSKISAAEGDIITAALDDLCRELKIKTRRVRLVISDPQVYSRHIRIPKVAEVELIKAIKWQAEKYTPFSIDDAVVDFQPLFSQSKNEDGQMGVIVIAAERKIIDKYMSMLKAVKLQPIIIDLAPFANVKALLRNYSIGEQEIVALIDIGTYTSSVTLLQGQSLIFVRSIDIAGSHMTRAIAESFNMNRSGADDLKKRASVILSGDKQDYDENDAKISSMVKPILDDMVFQIEKSFVYAEREFFVENVQKIYLCGGGAKFLGIENYLSEHLELPVEIVNPFLNITVNGKLRNNPILETYAPQLMAAMGEVL